MTNIYWIDLFCGAGGTSSGIHLSGKNVKVLACVNHDKNAIESHKLNHPDAHHFTEDIRDFTVVQKIKTLVDNIRKNEPEAFINIWASLECTNFSKAKGGLPKDADSRTLANHMFMYIEVLKPNYFWVENVREFMAWGPLDKNGKPKSRTNGKHFILWKGDICNYGYRVDHKILNSANYGAYQSRERLFMQFAKDDLPIAWPEQTHTKDKKGNELFPMPKWKPVREVLDLQDEGNSIFERKKPLSENTLKRILAGLEKFVAKGEKGFTKQYNSGSDNSRVKSFNEPVNNITTENSHAVVNTKHFIAKYFSGNPESKVIGIDGPAATVKTKDGQSLISTHLSTYYGNYGLHDIDTVAPTVTTKDRISKVDVRFIDQQYGNSKPSSVETVAGTITANPKLALVSPYMINANSSTCPPQDLEKPSPSITSRTHLLINPSWFGHATSTDEPSCTIIARQDKSPLYLLTSEYGHVAWVVFEDDSETTVKIKEFMVKHHITDIKMRMLKVPELLQIQGFPKDYKLVGTQTEQKKYIGNAVEVNMAKALIKANSIAISQIPKSKENDLQRFTGT